MQRGGFPFRTLVLALFVVGTVYLLYLYNTTLGRLREAELTAERYRREEETKTAQLQGVMRSKDELQEKCDNEKREFTNRLNSLNQQHKMLKSQYDEHEAEQMRLEQEMRRLREEFDQVEQQRNQEYQQLKAEKELELANIKDQVANYQRQNEQLQNQIATLRTQLQNGQQQVAAKNAQLVQQGHQGQGFQQGQGLQQGQAFQQGEGQGVQQGQDLQSQGHEGFGKKFLQQRPQFNAGNAQQQNHQGLVDAEQLHGRGAEAVFGQDRNLVNMNIEGEGAGGNNLNFQNQQDGVNAGGGFANQQQQQEALDNANQQHQVAPPVNPNVPEAPVNGNVDGNPAQQHVAVRNEEHQVAPPNLDADKYALKNLEAGAKAGRGDQHNDNPVALRQIVHPDIDRVERAADEDKEDENENVDVLQQPINADKFGHNAADEQDEEDGDHYRDGDKYEEDEQDNNNHKVHINPNLHNNPDADYA